VRREPPRLVAIADGLGKLEAVELRLAAGPQVQTAREDRGLERDERERIGRYLPFVNWEGIAKLFVAQLDDQELAIIERALGKVVFDCSFG
jgi:hypothetical protein